MEQCQLSELSSVPELTLLMLWEKSKRCKGYLCCLKTVRLRTMSQRIAHTTVMLYIHPHTLIALKTTFTISSNFLHHDSLETSSTEATATILLLLSSCDWMFVYDGRDVASSLPYTTPKAKQTTVSSVPFLKCSPTKTNNNRIIKEDSIHPKLRKILFWLNECSVYTDLPDLSYLN